MLDYHFERKQYIQNTNEASTVLDFAHNDNLAQGLRDHIIILIVYN